MESFNFLAQTVWPPIGNKYMYRHKPGMQGSIYVRHEILTRGCNLRQEIENSQTNFGDFLEFDGALAESQ